MDRLESQLGSSGSSGESSRADSRFPDRWHQHGLPSNKSLSSLPALPSTPAASKAFQDPYLSVHRSKPFRELLESATERSKSPARPVAPTPRSVAKTFEPYYPVLSARQSSSNLARDVKHAARNGASSPLAPMRWKSPAHIPLPESPEVESRSVRIVLPEEEEILVSPARLAPLPPSPDMLAASPAAVPRIATPSPPLSRSGSFRLAKHLPDMSNLLDASVGFGRESLGNETFDLNIAALRPKPTLRAALAPSTSRTGSIKVKRTLPASGSNHSLASVDEKHALDQSTLLPTSPIKRQDLLKDMITNESFFEEPSVYLPPPPPSVRKTPRRAGGFEGDVTMDIQTLMSKVRKPKRASGTEESFVDLLHGGEPSMMDLLADETFLPASIRRDPRQAKSTPRRASGGSPKTIAGQLSAYPLTNKGSPANPITHRRSAYSPAKTSPIKTLPDRQSAYTPRAATMTIIRSSPPPSSRTLHRPAATTPSRHAYTALSPTTTRTLPDRQMAYPTPSRTPGSGLIPDRQMAYASPAKLALPSPSKRSNPPAGTAETPRGRTITATPRTSNRRISLSAGAVPMPSASLRHIDLPPPTPRASAPVPSRTPGKTPSNLPAKINASIEAAKGHQRARSTGSALVAATASQPLTSGGPPRPRASVALARASALPPPRTEAKARTGSTPAAVVARTESNAKAAELGRATIAVRPSTRPGLALPSAAASTARTAPASTAARMDQIRSKIAGTRTFGADAGSKLNATGLPRPTTAAPAKSRALSTPATAPTRTTGIPASKAAAPGGVARPSGLPKPTTTSRLPTASGAAKSSVPPPSSSAGLASIRERLDRLQAKQATRGAR